jgi:hypothetical protein
MKVPTIAEPMPIAMIKSGRMKASESKFRAAAASKTPF